MSESRRGTDAVFGLSVESFLAKAKPAIVADLGEVEEVDEWEQRSIHEFGMAVIGKAAKYVPRWSKMDWKRRYEELRERKEREG